MLESSSLAYFFVRCHFLAFGGPRHFQKSIRRLVTPRLSLLHLLLLWLFSSTAEVRGATLESVLQGMGCNSSSCPLEGYLWVPFQIHTHTRTYMHTNTYTRTHSNTGTDAYRHVRTDLNDSKRTQCPSISQSVIKCHKVSLMLDYSHMHSRPPVLFPSVGCAISFRWLCYFISLAMLLL